MDEEDFVVMILNELSSDDDRKVRLLECSGEFNIPKSKTSQRLTNHYVRPQKKKVGSMGGTVLVVTAKGSSTATC